MQWFNDLRIARKILCLYVVMLLFVCAVGGVGYSFMKDINQNIENMYLNELLPVQWLNTIRHHLRANEASAKEMMLTSDAGRIAELKAMVKERTAEYDELLKQYMNLPGLEAFEKEHLARYSQAVEEYKRERDIAMGLAAEGKKAEAYQHYYAKVQKPLDAAQEELKALAEFNQKEAQEHNADNKQAFMAATLWMLGVLGLAVVMSLGLVIFITRSIANPIKKMLVLSEEIAQGNLSDRERAVVSQDEIGQLADALVRMREKLRELIGRVSRATDQVAASAEELTASAEQSAQAANQVAVIIGEVADGAAKQLRAVDNTTVSVDQMSASIQQISANASTVAGTSAQSADAAQAGSKAVEKAVSQMEHVEKTVARSAQVVTKLGDRSKEIGNIVDTISGIAGQTNLLALNAAIEAARAGEQGRGFAVVAEEVRKLAEQSEDAAKQIAELILEVQRETENAVAAMNEGTREVGIGAAVVNDAGRSFQDILELVNQASSQMLDISAAIQKMAGGSEQVAASVRDIDAVSKDTSDQAQTVSAATEEQSATMEEIAASSQALAKMAEDLAQAVGMFRL